MLTVRGTAGTGPVGISKHNLFDDERDPVQQHCKRLGIDNRLGSRVKEIAWETRADCRLEAYSLKDEFIHCYGSHEDILAAHGLSVDAIFARVAAA